MCKYLACDTLAIHLIKALPVKTVFQCIKALVSAPNLKPDKLVHSKQTCEEVDLSVASNKWKIQRTHIYSVSTLGLGEDKELLFYFLHIFPFIGSIIAQEGRRQLKSTFLGVPESVQITTTKKDFKNRKNEAIFFD